MILFSIRSLNWVCDKCGKIANLLDGNKAKPLTKEESELINSVTFKVILINIIMKTRNY